VVIDREGHPGEPGERSDVPFSVATRAPRRRGVYPATRPCACSRLLPAAAPYHSSAADRSSHRTCMNTPIRRWSRPLMAIASHLALLVIWYLFVKFGQVPRFVMPSPIDTASTLYTGNYNWWGNGLVTATEIYGGYLIALVVGVLFALSFTWFKTLEALVMPLLVSLNMIPKVALGPLIIVWFKYGVVPNMLIAFSICVFPILLTTVRGLREVEPELLDLVRALRGSRWQIFTKIQLPGAMPYIFSGMKVAAILAVAGAIVGEFLSSDKGLGYLMLQVQVTLDTAAMFMAVLLITLIGMLLYGAVVVFERMLVVPDARVS
jgi:NitT/TauT family transport system permease protein